MSDESYVSGELSDEELKAHEEKVFEALRGKSFIALSIDEEGIMFTGASNINTITSMNLLLTACSQILNDSPEKKLNKGETVQ